MLRLPWMISGIAKALRGGRDAVSAPAAAGEDRLIGRLMAEARAIDAIRADFADRLNGLGIGGILPRKAFEFPIADALGIGAFERADTAAARARRYAEEVAALVGDGWKPADALRATVAESGKSTPRLRTSEHARAVVAHMLQSAPEEAEPVGELSEEDMLSNLARAQAEPAPDWLERLSASQLSALLDVYHELVWANMGPNGLLQPVGYTTVRDAIAAVFAALAGPRR